MQNQEVWRWAALNQEQLGMLEEAEQTLGTDILLAYQAGERKEVSRELFPRLGLRAADLDESQVECLQGLESKLKSVVIAYQKL
jgi:hypothetical protein